MNRTNRSVLYTMIDNVFEGLSKDDADGYLPAITDLIQQGNDYSTIWNHFMVAVITAVKERYLTGDQGIVNVLDSLVEAHRTFIRGDKPDGAEMRAVLERATPIVQLLASDDKNLVNLSTVSFVNAVLFSVLFSASGRDQFMQAAIDQIVGFFTIRMKELDATATDDQIKSAFFVDMGGYLFTAIDSANNQQPPVAVATGTAVPDETNVPGDVVQDALAIPSDGTVVTDVEQLANLKDQLASAGINLPNLSAAQAHAKMPPVLERALISLGVDTTNVLGIALIYDKEESAQKGFGIGSQELAN